LIPKQPHFNEAELALEQYQSGLARFGPIFGAKLALFILQCSTPLVKGCAFILITDAHNRL